MTEYVIYYGMGGSYGGASHCMVIRTNTEEDALFSAREQATDVYESSQECYSPIECEECQGTGLIGTDHEDCGFCNGEGERDPTSEEEAENLEMWIEFHAEKFNPKIHTIEWLQEHEADDRR